MAIAPEIDENDPLSELIVQYSQAELKEIIGKVEPSDVRDLLLLLPETDFLFYFNFTAAQRKAMLNGETINHVQLSEVDVPNGYIQSGFEGVWEMFAKKIDGVWNILVYENNCAEYCSTVLAKTYVYYNGKLYQQHHANLAGYQDVWIELFIDLDQLNATQKETANALWEGTTSNNVLFRLPRDGKTITMHIDANCYTDAGIPESAIKEVKVEL